MKNWRDGVSSFTKLLNLRSDFNGKACQNRPTFIFRFFRGFYVHENWFKDFLLCMFVCSYLNAFLQLHLAAKIILSNKTIFHKNLLIFSDGLPSSTWRSIKDTLSHTATASRQSLELNSFR